MSGHSKRGKLLPITIMIRIHDHPWSAAEPPVTVIPSTPAGMRLIGYESRMAKIRQKNQEKMVDLRKKLDAKLGIGAAGDAGIDKTKKEEYGFKFPYDTLRRRKRKDSDEVRENAPKQERSLGKSLSYSRLFHFSRHMSQNFLHRRNRAREWLTGRRRPRMTPRFTQYARRYELSGRSI